jgi:hypothetical protein
MFIPTTYVLATPDDVSGLSFFTRICATAISVLPIATLRVRKIFIQGRAFGEATS